MNKAANAALNWSLSCRLLGLKCLRWIFVKLRAALVDPKKLCAGCGGKGRLIDATQRICGECLAKLYRMMR